MLKSDILRLFFSYAAQDPHSKSRFVNSWFFHSPILFFVYEFEGKKKRKKIILSLPTSGVFGLSRLPCPVYQSFRFIRFSLQTKTEELWISFHNSVFKFFIFQIRSHSIVVPTCFIVRIICHFVRCRSVFLGLLWWNIFAFPVVLVRDMLEMVQ